MATQDTPADDDGSPGKRPIRATTEERERVLRELSDATARGQIELGEFDERSGKAWQARDRGELAGLIDDIVPDPMDLIAGSAFPRGNLPARHSERSPANPEGRPDPTAAVPKVTGAPGSSWSVAVMSGAEKKGEWTCGRSHNVLTAMGGALIDLRDANFEAGETVITVYAVMGGVEILVPEDVRVIEHGVGLMGGFGSGRSKKVTLRDADLPSDAPVVRVRGVAIMGGAEVKRVPRAHGKSGD
ncbi:MAG: DUF1707 SHOCT-like domain-containing protein [Mycobacteriaceae bacterium]|uniref:DUF1707 SHOCT-like domain-containing protein n=1 Tax=Corynebacterium sp. TaxID=1720 RepID=UPI003F9BD9DF